ncbi:hypothetical protein [Streptomyces sp. bgisy022]|uniref:hypothetical protein n=1 Tax=Streptomyces sp. bgisy022 TaxID=3413769 RepID=UPI003D752339
MDLSIEMTMSQWHHIDGDMDNEVSLAARDGRDDTVEWGRAVREAGWKQVGGWNPDVPGSGTWPPEHEWVSVTLSRQQWRFVVHVLDTWADIDSPAAHWELAASRLRAIIVAALGDESP